MTTTLTLEELEQGGERDLGATDWVTLDQERIDRFARGDRRPPVDPRRPGAGGAGPVRRHDRARLPVPVAAAGPDAGRPQGRGRADGDQLRHRPDPVHVPGPRRLAGAGEARSSCPRSAAGRASSTSSASRSRSGTPRNLRSWAKCCIWSSAVEGRLPGRDGRRGVWPPRAARRRSRQGLRPLPGSALGADVAGGADRVGGLRAAGGSGAGGGADRAAFARARSGGLVEVGCAGGLGRTGTVLACMATLAGVQSSEAVAWVRANYDQRAVETAEQEAFVERFAA